jgi:hypothetical protein
MNKLLTSLLGTFLVLTNPAATAKRREAGQGTLEYVAMIAVAAIIIAAVGTILKTQAPVISGWVTAAIAKVQAAVTG